MFHRFFRAASAVLLSASLALSLLIPVSAEEPEVDPFVPDVELRSQAAVLTNLDDGEILFSHNGDKQLYPASLVKIMTCLLAVESGVDFSTPVTAPDYVFDELYGLGASTADIRHGEVVEFGDLIYATMLPSACEAASIIAHHLSDGNIPAFVQQMNDKAAELGATNTHFTNAHGLHDPDQYTTAEDMTRILLYALKNEQFTTVVTTQNYTMKATNKHAEPRTYQHTNYMMSKGLGGQKYYYPYVQGIKTGTTDEAGRNLASMATKDGYRYLLVTLGAPSYDEEKEEYIVDNGAFLDAIDLYDWAFNNLRYRTVYTTGDILESVSVKYAWDVDTVNLSPSSNITILLPQSLKTEDLKLKSKLPGEPIKATVEKGQEIGSGTLSYGDRTLAAFTLVAEQRVERSVVVAVSDNLFGIITSWQFLLIFGIIVALLVFYIWVTIRYNRRRRRRRAIEARYRNNPNRPKQ